MVVPSHVERGFVGVRSGQGRFSAGSKLCTVFSGLLQATESSSHSVDFSGTPQDGGILRSVLSSFR